MRKIILTFLFFICCTILFAQKKDDFKPGVKVGGVIFTGWEFNIDDAEFISRLDTNQPNPNVPFGFNPAKNQFEVSKNSFYLERTYINIRASLTPQVNARITPDIFSFTDGNGRTQYSLNFKYAYVNYVPLQTESGLSLGFTFGIIPNNWVNTNDRYWGYRGFSKSLTDFSWTASAVRSGVNVNRTAVTYFSSADLGMDIMLSAPKGFAELNVEILNGNGFRNLSFDNRFKDILVTAFIHPLAAQIKKRTESNKKSGKERLEGITDLTIGGFGYLGKLDKGENYTPNAVQFKRNRFGGMAHFKFNFKKNGFFKIGGEFSVQLNRDPASNKPDSLVEINSRGFSTYLEFNPPVAQINERLMLVARYDMFDPNTDDNVTNIALFNPKSFHNTTDKQSLLLLGLAFKPFKPLTLGVTYQSLMYDQNFVVKYDGTTSKTDARFLFHTILDF